MVATKPYNMHDLAIFPFAIRWEWSSNFEEQIGAESDIQNAHVS